MSNFKRNGSRGRDRSRHAFDETGDSGSFFDGSGRTKRSSQKTAQLCRQVFRAVSLALEECGDDVLRELSVVDVEPAPDASRLLVRVSVPVAGGELALPEVLARLGRAGGFLRRQVAAAITRKRAPELMFTFAAPGAGEVGA
jgi:ribosome-binding factor A